MITNGFRPKPVPKWDPIRDYSGHSWSKHFIDLVRSLFIRAEPTSGLLPDRLAAKVVAIGAKATSTVVLGVGLAARP